MHTSTVVLLALAVVLTAEDICHILWAKSNKPEMLAKNGHDVFPLFALIGVIFLRAYAPSLLFGASVWADVALFVSFGICTDVHKWSIAPSRTPTVS